MRAFRFPVVAILSILVGCSALVYGQDEKPQPDQPRQEEPKAQPKQDEAKPPRQDEAKPPKAEKPEGKQQQKQEQKESQDQMKSNQMKSNEMKSNEMKSNQQAHPEQPGGNAHPAGKGGHIPDDKFRAHFGRSHHFAARSVIVSGQPQFQYSGYTFELVDPWPQDWAYTDDCYIDYIDGEYFLFDLLHPGVRIAVFVVM
ncbi:MAG: hypothetical protein WAN03_20905 [Candidatus Sulfotelmatobacter sp.]